MHKSLGKETSLFNHVFFNVMGLTQLQCLCVNDVKYSLFYKCWVCWPVSKIVRDSFSGSLQTGRWIKGISISRSSTLLPISLSGQRHSISLTLVRHQHIHTLQMKAETELLLALLLTFRLLLFDSPLLFLSEKIMLFTSRFLMKYSECGSWWCWNQSGKV